jgi:hypothetical protein
MMDVFAMILSQEINEEALIAQFSAIEFIMDDLGVAACQSYFKTCKALSLSGRNLSSQSADSTLFRILRFFGFIVHRFRGQRSCSEFCYRLLSRALYHYISDTPSR